MIFKLPVELTIFKVNQCKLQFISTVKNTDDITFDDSAVVRIDTVGVQLLLAFVTHLAAHNIALTWLSNSPIIKKSVDQLGIGDSILKQYFIN